MPSKDAYDDEYELGELAWGAVLALWVALVLLSMSAGAHEWAKDCPSELWMCTDECRCIEDISAGGHQDVLVERPCTVYTKYGGVFQATIYPENWPMPKDGAICMVTMMADDRTFIEVPCPALEDLPAHGIYQLSPMASGLLWGELPCVAEQDGTTPTQTSEPESDFEAWQRECEECEPDGTLVGLPSHCYEEADWSLWGDRPTKVFWDLGWNVVGTVPDSTVKYIRLGLACDGTVRWRVE